MNDGTDPTDRDLVAEAVRDACMRAAAHAYEDGGMRGLCAEGRWELALDAMRGVDLREVIERAQRSDDASRAPTDEAPGET